MPKFIDVAYIRNMPLGVPQGSLPSDETLDEYIETASEFVENYLERQITPAVISERIVGSDRYTLILDEYPIVGLSSVTEVGYHNEQNSIDTSNFLVHSKSGMIEWLNKTRYFRPDRLYVVTYTAGMNPIPRAIKHATALQVIEMLQPQYAGMTSDNAELVPETSAQFVDLLEPYRRKRMA